MALATRTGWSPRLPSRRTFISTVTEGKSFPDYVEFISDRSRLEIINECLGALHADFYYVLAFDPGDGFFIEAHPKVSLRARLALSEGDRHDMLKCFDAVSSALETRAEIKLKAEKMKRKIF